MTFTESVGSRPDPSSSPRPPQRRDGVRGDGPQPTGTSPAQVLFAVVYVAVFPRGSAKSVAGCLMFGVFGVLTGVRRGPAGTVGGV